MKTEILILTVLVIAAAFYVSSFTGLFVGLPTTHAKRIIDGDTIEIEGPERVRLIGIDTPEKGQFLFEEATQRLEELIGGKEILLEADITERDKYGRLLRYVFIDRKELVNSVLVREGLAKVMIYPPDRKYEDELLESEAEARSRNLGVWQYSGIPDAFCIGIYYLKYNAAGDDRKNLNDEYVEFRNKCEYPVDMTGWIAEDRAGHRYMFPAFTAMNKTKFKLRTGAGTDSAVALHWGSSTPVWNNGGDTMTLSRPDGQLMLEYEYEGY